MSRIKSKQSTDVCGDCGSTEPMWASINKGILLCNHCCHTHRSLGRHVSIVKSIQKSTWPQSLLTMVFELNNGGVNNIWENQIIKDPKLAKRKPSPTDSLEDKAKFIKAKHQNCEFVFRSQTEDNMVCYENELGKQLHASVRSNNLITSFRLLIQGADPNYFHDEKGSTPLHASVKANQLLQAELLMVYGADPTYPDANGKTAIDYARQTVNKTLMQRLIESQFEVTDKFSHYLCYRKPDHSQGVDFLIPTSGARSHPGSMDKLKKLSNQIFEELVKDVYDEVDRREIEAIWLGSADTIDLSAVPFLPVDPSLSTTRNQSRQKLGRFASPELNALIYDILVDSQRRQKLSDKGQPRQISQLSDDDPLYDSVASDDDYAVVPSEEVLDQNQNNSIVQSERMKNELLSKKLCESADTIKELKSEIGNLKGLIEHLSSENHDLKNRLAQCEVSNFNGNITNKFVSNGNSGPQSLDAYLMSRPQEELNNQFSLSNGKVIADNNNIDIDGKKKGQRPSSMYEARERIRPVTNWQLLKKSKQLESKNQTIMQCTEQVTKGISELWKCIQSGCDNHIQCAEKIRIAVVNLIKALPMENDTVKHLMDSVAQLQTNCVGLENSTSVTSDNFIQKVRSSAYQIAKDTKELVTKYNAH
ncbi:PREDICTED: ARF GTPase-activating protein GIT2 [Nicrophorus vespilloides]|uniref:ARF GTPase-activating protein GIT2 n=1 Tax=Nicrophorus vespilloides TaxID=110193 RepID=A0ABM1MB32_NICVS|nr:PREDICTED: ARF GTPase-activating protein GIT2 [Nicrophorus vespilloides]